MQPDAASGVAPCLRAMLGATGAIEQRCRDVAGIFRCPPSVYARCAKSAALLISAQRDDMLSPADLPRRPSCARVPHTRRQTPTFTPPAFVCLLSRRSRHQQRVTRFAQPRFHYRFCRCRFSDATRRHHVAASLPGTQPVRLHYRPFIAFAVPPAMRAAADRSFCADSRAQQGEDVLSAVFDIPLHQRHAP